jgi:DNA-binding transcriptional LysR family regulator
MMLNLREMEVFRRVMEDGSVTAAAEALHISQPAVSRILQGAEQRLGFALFLRRHKRMIATAEAQALLPDVVSAFAAFDQARQRAIDLRSGRAGVLKIAAIAAFANALLPAAVQRFRASRPDSVVTLQAMTALQAATQVANHQADVGFIIDSMSIPGVSVSDLCATEFGCVMPRKHRLSARRWITPADLENETLICLGRHQPLGMLAMRAFADADVPLRTAIEVSQSTVACALVRAGAGLALLDRLGLMGAPGSDLVMRPFHPSVLVTARLVHPRHQPPSLLVKEFVAVLRELIAAETGPVHATKKAATRRGAS